jgi:hypothetical protein
VNRARGVAAFLARRLTIATPYATAAAAIRRQHEHDGWGALTGYATDYAPQPWRWPS